VATIILMGCSGERTGSPSATSVGPTTTREVTPATVTTSPPVAICPSLGDRLSREQLLDQVDGFARVADTTGAGLEGFLYVVTSTADAGPGTLRDGLEQAGRWVVFDQKLFPSDRETVIVLNSAIQIASDSTLDGRCANVRLAPTKRADGALFVGYYADRGVDNVMITNIRIGPIPGQGDEQSGDGIRIVWGSDRFYVSHAEVFSANDEAIEITRGDRGPMRGTVSYSHIATTAKAVLIGDQTRNVEKGGGWAPDNQRIQVTFHHDWFDKNMVRSPLVTDAIAHLYNNFVSSYGQVGNDDESAGQEFGGEAWVWTEGNVIEPLPGGDPCGIDVINYGSLGVTGSTHLTTKDNVFRDGAKFCSFRKTDPPNPIDVPYDYVLDDSGPNGTWLTDELTNGDPAVTGRAGWLLMR
jgi:pectate lyase